MANDKMPPKSVMRLIWLAPLMMLGIALVILFLDPANKGDDTAGAPVEAEMIDKDIMAGDAAAPDAVEPQ